MTSFEPFIRRDLHFIEKSQTFQQAACMLLKSDLGCLLVIDEQEEGVVLVTQGDLIRRGAVAQGWSQRRVFQVMSRPFIVADTRASCEDVIELLRSSHLLRLPFVRTRTFSKQSIIGEVSRHQIILSEETSPDVWIQLLRGRPLSRHKRGQEQWDRYKKRKKIRNDAQLQQTIHRFYHQFAKSLSFSRDVIGNLIFKILSRMCMRVSYRSSIRFCAQLPSILKQKLLALPSGLNLKFTVHRLIKELSQQLKISGEKSCEALMLVLIGVAELVCPLALKKLACELPQEFHPFIEAAINEVTQVLKIRFSK